MKISVIIPVYKVEQYLDRCIESIVDQTYMDLEIILVDDESPDNSGTICDLWAKRDERIIVIHKKNGGLGEARNAGIDIASGTFVSFVDSDDYLKIETYEKLVNALVKNNSDACYFGCYQVSRFGYQFVIKPPFELFFSGEDVTKKFLVSVIAPEPNESQNGFTGISACTALYSLGIIKNNKIKFLSERKILSEDLIFNIEFCAKAKSVIILPENLYYYCYNEDSLSQKYSSDRFEASKRMHEMLIRKAEELEILEILSQKINRIYLVNLSTCFNREVAYSKHRTIQALRNIKLMCMDQFTMQCLNDYPINRMTWKQRPLFMMTKLNCSFGIAVYINLKFLIKHMKKELK